MSDDNGQDRMDSDHDAGGAPARAERDAGGGGDHGHDHDHGPPSGNGRSERPAEGSGASDTEAPSPLPENRDPAEPAVARSERNRLETKASEPPIDANKAGATSWSTGSAGPVRLPQDNVRVSASTRWKYEPDIAKPEEPQEPDSLIEAIIEYIKDRGTGAKWNLLLEIFNTLTEHTEGNPVYAEPPIEPAVRVQYFANLRRHYENRLSARVLEIALKDVPQNTAYTLSNVQIQSRSLCPANPPGASIRATQPHGADSIREGQLQSVDSIIAGDREAQELRELVREAAGQEQLARKDYQDLIKSSRPEDGVRIRVD